MTDFENNAVRKPPTPIKQALLGFGSLLVGHLFCLLILVIHDSMSYHSFHPGKIEFIYEESWLIVYEWLQLIYGIPLIIFFFFTKKRISSLCVFIGMAIAFLLFWYLMLKDGVDVGRTVGG